MGKRERIQMKKIDNPAARQVTFSKRRRGLMKKAEELSILCDAEVGIVVFSSTGRLFEFASTSMKQIIQRYKSHSQMQNPEQMPADFCMDEITRARLRREYLEAELGLRQMTGEYLDNMTINEIQQLENKLHTGLNCVLDKKDEKIMNEIDRLQKKRRLLMEENCRLKEQVLSMNILGAQAIADPESVVVEERQSSESVTNAWNPRPPPDTDESSDTSLHLKLSLG